MPDIVIKNALLVDGTGAKPFPADIAVAGGLITEIADSLGGRPARSVIEAGGLAVFPGFIDIHRHGDLVPFLEKPSFEELSQGITTFVSGLCGFSPAPNAGDHFTELKEYAEPIIGAIPDLLRGCDFKGFLDAVKGRSLPSNVGYLVGNGALRVAAAGFAKGPLTREEMDQVKRLLRESLEAGALGLSIGLMYVPEMFYRKDELSDIFGVLAEFKRPVVAHVRGEGRSLLESLDEVFSAALPQGVPVHISHFKAAGKRSWRTLIPQALELIQEKRSEGYDITFDVYPYTAGSTALYTLLPPWQMAGGVQELLKRLADPATRRTIEAELRREHDEWDNMIYSTGWQSVTIAGGADAAIVGKNLQEIAEAGHESPEECAMRLIIENQGNIPMVFHSMCEEDMLSIIASPGAVVVSDSLYSAGGLPHPRKFGAQARFVSRYALEKRSVSLEDAVMRCTSLPAKRMGLDDRGRILEGMKADLQLVDLKAYKDTATYAEPHSYPTGIRYVVVNGKIVLDSESGRKACNGALLKA